MKTYTERPLELGHVTRGGGSAGGYSYRIIYPDSSDPAKTVTYAFLAPKEFRVFTRDTKGFLYTISTGAGERENDIVHRYDLCGKLTGSMQIAASRIDTHPVANPSHPVGEVYELHEEYGNAVIGPNGDVYTWARTPDEYKILKWAWVDSPDDPKGGPDKPLEFQALPSTSGVYLTWTASPQDPGCVTGYDIERGTSATGSFTNLTTVPTGATYNYNDKNAAAGQTWYYKVKARSEIGDSDAATASAAR